MATAIRPPTAYVKFRMPYTAIDVYVDPKTGQNPTPGNTLDDAGRSAMKRSQALSQARYDRWVKDLTDRLAKAMPSLASVDKRPSPDEHVIAAGSLFTVSIVAENWCFAVKLSSNPNAKNRGAQSACFPRFCRSLRDVLLQCDAGGSMVAKRSQASFTPISSLSDKELDGIASVAKLRLPAKRQKTVTGYNEPAKKTRKNKTDKEKGTA